MGKTYSYKTSKIQHNYLVSKYTIPPVYKHGMENHEIYNLTEEKHYDVYWVVKKSTME